MLQCRVPPSPRSRTLRHLSEDYHHAIRDPLWQHIAVSEDVRAIIQLAGFQELRGIMQLGPAHIVYPGATHSRFAHSLGVFHLARLLLTQLLRTSEWQLEPEEARAFLFAALIHDVGHYPYAHSLKDLGLRRHEQLTADWVRSPEPSALFRERLGVDPALVASVVDAGANAGVDSPSLPLFRRLLSGLLDPDKLDYLNRDAYHCGVPYGIQDIDYVLGALTLASGPGGDRLTMARKGVPAIEATLFARYLMYRTVYWHKTVRAATSMIKKAVLVAMEEGALVAAQLYHQDDAGFQRLLSDAPPPSRALAARVFERRLLRVVHTEPYDQLRHAPLEAPAARLPLEAQLAELLSSRGGRPIDPHEVVIDVPESISFEVDIDVEGAPAATQTVFDRDVVAGFHRQLRAVTILAPEDSVTPSHVQPALAEVLGEH